VRTLPIKPTAVWGVAREIKAAAEDLEPIVVAGAAALAEEIGRHLAAGGDERWVRMLAGREPAGYDLDGAGVLVYAVEGERAGSAAEESLRLAERKRVPAVCVLVGVPAGSVPDVPYVLATDVVAAPPGATLPLEAIVEAVAAKVGDNAYALAGKLPALRKPVCAQIVRSFSRQNGVLGAAIFIPGADFPALTLNQIRMVLRIAGAYGVELDRERALEILGVVGAGLGLRTVARELLGFVPVGGWALKGGIAYAGTRALGEAAIRYFEAGGAERVGKSVRSRS
jgi:uncharacterized protein (DUF697 family)